jgi:hypothetical protein
MGCARVEIIGDFNSRFAGVVLQNSADFIEAVYLLRIENERVICVNNNYKGYCIYINHAIVCDKLL